MMSTYPIAFAAVWLILRGFQGRSMRPSHLLMKLDRALLFFCDSQLVKIVRMKIEAVPIILGGIAAVKVQLGRETGTVTVLNQVTRGYLSGRTLKTGLGKFDQRSLVYLHCPQNLTLRFVDRRFDHRIKLSHRIITHPPQDRIQGPGPLMLFLLFV